MRKPIQSVKIILAKKLTKIMALIILLTSFVFSSVALFSIYRYMGEQAETIVEAVEVGQSSGENWLALMNAYLAHEDDNVMMIEMKDGRRYFSRGARETFLALASKRKWGHLVFLDNGAYYTVQDMNDDYRLSIAIEASALMALFWRLFWSTLCLLIVLMVAGAGYIYWKSRDWSEEMLDLTNRIKQLSPLTDEQLPTDYTIAELNDIAIAFNSLLQAQRAAVLREQTFVVNASHDLKTPIAAIRGHVNLIKRRGAKNPEIIAESLDYIDHESKRMEQLVQQLLSLAKAEVVQPKRMEVLGQWIKEEVIHLTQNASQTIHIQVDETIRMETSLHYWRPIVSNLIENAINYSKSSDMIIIQFYEDDNRLYFIVSDTGEGIPTDEKERIFDRFYRGEHSQRQGSGIGLSIVRAMTEQLHGTISVKDYQPKGVSFEVVIPK
ncbi:HAMP domain-containing histidine kinase [Aerococcaceae bacterium zg-ZJ1578]|uniref:sensor histidine kinase n=1 Tax=Aerococcaceae bacterium zg-252 TaxID=2796928 RepID=UPI001A23F2EB|nr:HAMP domain-containing histidine kinase [Aerococcaceae bacterium zg-1578]